MRFRRTAPATVRSANHGFTLTEVMVASVVFLFGFQAATLGFGLARQQQAEAEHMRAAIDIATQMRTRLLARGDTSCGGAGVAVELTRDRIDDNSLICLGVDGAISASLAQCSFDHPQDQQEMDIALGIERTDGARELFRYSNLAPYDVSYGPAGPYRAVWNVHCATVDGVNTAKTVQVVVAWPPLSNAFQEGRYIRLRYSPADVGG